MKKIFFLLLCLLPSTVKSQSMQKIDKWTKIAVVTDTIANTIVIESIDKDSFNKDADVHREIDTQSIIQKNEKIISILYTTFIVDCANGSYALRKALELDGENQLVQLMQIGKFEKLNWKKIEKETFAELKYKILCTAK